METRRKADARRPALPEKPETTIRVQTYGSPCGELLLGSFGESLAFATGGTNDTGDSWTGAYDVSCGPCFIEAPSPLLDEAARQLDEYFAGYRRTFDIPLSFARYGVPEDRLARAAGVPFGATVSYGELARPHRPAESRAGPWPMRTARTRSRSSSPATASSAATVR